MQKPIVGIFSDTDVLSLSIVENLLASFCKVKIFTKEKKLWKEKTLHIGSLGNIEIVTEGNLGESAIDYFIFINTSISGVRPKEIIKKFELVTKNVKSLFVFSYRILSKEAVAPLSVNQNSGVIYIGDLFGPRSAYDQKNLIFPVFIPDAARLVVKWLFSFGPYGEEIFLYSKSITPEARQKENILPGSIRRVFLKTNLSLATKETLDWLESYQPKKARPSFKKPFLVFFLIFFLVSPFVFNLFSSLSIFAAIKLGEKGNLHWARNLLFVSKGAAGAGSEESLVFSKVPILEKLYLPSFYLSSVLSKATDLGGEALEVYGAGEELSGKIFGDDVYDPEGYSQKINLGLSTLYQNTSFLQSELARSPDFLKPLFSKIFSKVDLEEVKVLSVNGSRLARQIPQILGAGKPATYLVLLQNNMELRPTGGFIGSFALVTFDGGRLTDVTLDDVYSSDGQLKGHVEPPRAIRNYLGEASWYLRDSNWDPDFSVSAQNAEWFLDKELDKSVDGVVGVDLEFIKSLLRETGPIALSDFNTQINADNLYEKTQSEVESNFFPGSRKKKNFLTAVGRQLLAQITKLPKKKHLDLSKSVFLQLSTRHIQIFLHNQNAQKEIGYLSWDGGVNLPVCGKNCFSPWLGLVEANVGVNKANYFIERKGELTVSLDPEFAKSKLVWSLTNTASATFEPKDKYKVYLRVLAPELSEFNQVASALEITEISGRKEAGVLAEVSPGQTKNVVFEWRVRHGLSFDQSGELLVFWRKQAGTGPDPVSINVSLTRGKPTSYNTTLGRDFFSRISW